MISPSGTPEKGEKVPEKQADGIDEKRRRQNTKETTAKPWIADGNFKQGLSPLSRGEKEVQQHSGSPKLGTEKLS